MARSVTVAFEEFRSRLEITPVQKNALSTTQANLRSAVESRFKVLDSFLMGSYARQTLIAPLKTADIDIFFVLDPQYYATASGSSLLAQFRETIAKTYPRTPRINRSGQAVTITFSDYSVDAVPGFYRKGGGFLILGQTLDTWVSTDPAAHADMLTRENRYHNGRLVPLIKMLKKWNMQTGDHFGSFYMELFAMKLLEKVTISDYASGCRWIFDKGVDAIRYTIPDPAGFGEEIRGLVDIDVSTAVNQFSVARDVAIQAENADRMGYPSNAIAIWRGLFGDGFPTFG